MLLKPQTKAHFLEKNFVLGLFTAKIVLKFRDLVTFDMHQTTLKFWISSRFAQSAGIVLNHTKFCCLIIRHAINQKENMFSRNVWKLKHAWLPRYFTVFLKNSHNFCQNYSSSGNSCNNFRFSELMFLEIRNFVLAVSTNNFQTLNFFHLL